MADSPEDKRLEALEQKLAAARQVKTPGRRHEDHTSGAQAGWRMVTELVVGLLLGFGIGYGLDSLFGTLPIFLILFTLLGFAAGVRTMMRSAAEMQAQNSKAGDKPAPSVKPDDMYDD